MGLAKGGVKVLLSEAARIPFRGRLLTLGRQDVWLDFETLKQIAREFGFPLHDPGAVVLSRKAEFAARGYISDECLFKALGFKESRTLDYSDFESADYMCDLNGEDLPPELWGQFDVIVDGGTIEHVFHVPNALRNIYRMLAPHGRIIHISPSSNHMDHGFYMFSPTLFWDFYQENKFEISNLQVFRYTPRHFDDPWQISYYKPGCLDPISFGGLDDGMYGIVCIATKMRESTGDRVPQQGSYVYGGWKLKERPPEQNDSGPVSGVIPSRTETIKTNLRRFPAFYAIAKIILKPFRLAFRRPRAKPPRKGMGLRVVARY